MSEAGDIEAVSYALHDLAERGDAAGLAKALADDEAADADTGGAAFTPHAFLSIDARDHFGCTPLHVAIINRHLDVVKACIAAGCEMLVGLAGLPYLHYAITLAAQKANLPFVNEVVPVLLAAGAAWNEIDRRERTAVHIAAQYGCTTLLEMARDAEADFSEADGWGRTALHYAAENGHTAAVELVMAVLAKAEHPEVVQAKDNKGSQTAADLAADNFHWAAHKLLLGDDWASHPAHASSGSPPQPTAAKALVYEHVDCRQHHTASSHARGAAEAPPENELRLHVLTEPVVGSLRADAIQQRVRWSDEPPLADMADVLRVHEFSYVHRILEACGGAEADPEPEEGKTHEHDIRLIDHDTVVCRDTFRGALRAAGAVVSAVQAVCSGEAHNAFCAVRPPGHHAGPHGLVTCPNDPEGSHGFCIFNNVAVAAAFARSHAELGVAKVAIFDFDVHHGNGTEAIVRNVRPTKVSKSVALPFGQASFSTVSYKPWLDRKDGDNIFFTSIHGFGKAEHGKADVPNAAWFYPASGISSSEVCGSAAAEGAGAEVVAKRLKQIAGATIHGAHEPSCSGAAYELFESKLAAPTVMNVGLPRSFDSSFRWRHKIRCEVLPKLHEFKPDLILISAGFDGHMDDALNHGYLALTEDDYTWVTRQLVKVANVHCPGRIVSALEGGYRIAGVGQSAFAQSVAAHVAELAAGRKEVWDPELEAAAAAAALTQHKLERAGTPFIAPSSEPAATSSTAQAADADAPATAGAAIAEAAEPAPATAQPAAKRPASPTFAASSRRPKRRRRAAAAPVDYAALNKQLEEQEAAAKAAAKAAKLAAAESGDPAGPDSAAAGAGEGRGTAAKASLGTAAFLEVDDEDDDDDDGDFQAGDEEDDEDDEDFVME